MFFDALRVKIREEAVVRNKAIYLALGAVFPATTLQTCLVHLMRNQPRLCQLEGPQGTGSGDPADLHGAQR